MIVPGTLCAFSPEQFSAIELGITLGKSIKESFPGIAQDYREGNSSSKIVEKYNLTVVDGCSFKVIQSAVYRALRGYNGSMFMIDTEPYEGLISDIDEFKKLAESNNKKSGELVGNAAFTNGTGIFALTKKQQYDASCAGAIACGSTPYTDDELKFIQQKISNPEYFKGKLLNVQRIANEVNELFHNKKETRSAKAITKVVLRKGIIRDEKSVQTKYSQEELDLIKILANNPKYKKGDKFLLKEMCEEINKVIHSGKNVRSSNVLNKIITRKKFNQKPSS
jgi:hypothetical protein